MKEAKLACLYACREFEKVGVQVVRKVVAKWLFFAFFDEHSTGTPLTVQCHQISTAHIKILF